MQGLSLRIISSKGCKYLLGLLAIVMVFATTPILAQNGLATITGTVTDQSGAILPGVSVTASRNATDQKVTVVTSEAGVYAIRALPIGAYTLTVADAGFKTGSRSGIVLSAEQSATINFALTVGSQEQTVNVEADSASVQTESSSISQTVSPTAIVELPLNGRNPGALVTLTAGVVPGSGSGFTTATGLYNPNDTIASANGGRVGSIYFMLDGANNMDPATLFGGPFPNPDATQEFSVISNNFGAQYGFAAGGIVSIVTKSGTNQWHGDAFEFLRNYNLNAADYFSHLTDTLIRNQYGASIGGPLWHNKIFIFGNYQRTSETSSVTGTPAFVPNAAELSGNWSQLFTGTTKNLCGSGGPSNLSFDSGQLFQPRTETNYVCPAGTGNAGQTVQVKTPYLGNQINTTTYSPLALKIEENLPQTTAANNLVYIPGIARPDSTNEFTIRGDYIISDKQRLNGHVFYQKYNLPAVPGKGNFLAAQPSWVSPYTSYNVGWIDAISSKIVNTATFSYVPSSTLDEPVITDKSGTPVSLTSLGMNVPYPSGFPQSIEGFGVSSYFSFPPSGYAAIFSSKAVSASDQLSLNEGKHLLVAGVDVLHYNWTEQADWLALPLISFTGQSTGNGAADFLTGSVDNFVQGGGEYNKTAITSWASYLQDTYHATQHLTLNAGVRWEPYFPSSVNAGRIATFRPGQQSTRYPNAPVGLVYPHDQGITDTGGVANSPWQFSPRLGFAFQPKSLPKTSLRGSFGIFISPIDNSYYQHAGDSAPFSPTYTLNYSQYGTIPFADPWTVSTSTGGASPFPPFSSATYAPPSTAPFVTPVGVEASFASGFKQGRDQTWNLSAQQMFANTLVTVAYVGSQTYHLPVYIDRNPGIYASHGLRTTYPEFSTVYQYQSAGNASYNALEVLVEKQLGRELTFTSNYTFSKALDTVTGGNTAYAGPIGNPFDIKWNYGISDVNHTHNWMTSFVYKTPSLSQYNHLAQAALGNWQTSGIFTLRSGSPFSVGPGGACTNGGNPSYSTDGGDRADTVPGQSFGTMQGSKSHWLKQYFNTAAFACNAVGTFGDSGRNLLTGPRYNNWDLGFAKEFPIRERFKFQFRWEMFDAMNTPHFSNPGSSVGGGGYGAINSLAAPPRIMQAAGKFTW